METAGKEVEDAELREAMKDSGIGTPATRAGIIELLINREYIEREGRALVATEKGIQVIRLLNGHPLTSPELTGNWEKRLRLIEHGEDTRPAFMKDIASFTTETVQELDKLKGVRIERAKLGPCPVCGREITENRKGYSCWSRDDPGCGFVIWKRKAGKSLPVSVAKELIASLKASRERGEDPGVGRTAKAVTGFRGRSGRSFRAKLKLEQTDEGKWRVDFDEEWAKEPPKEQAEAEEQQAGRAAGRGLGESEAEKEKPPAPRARRYSPAARERNPPDRAAAPIVPKPKLCSLRSKPWLRSRRPFHPAPFLGPAGENPSAIGGEASTPPAPAPRRAARSPAAAGPRRPPTAPCPASRGCARRSPG